MMSAAPESPSTEPPESEAEAISRPLRDVAAPPHVTRVPLRPR